MRVFYSTPWLPAEWIKAHGIEPRGIWADGHFIFGSLPLTAGACAFSQAALRLADANRESAFVFSTHCDQMRRAFDAAFALPRQFLFNLPATWETPVAVDLFAAELERLGRFLVGLGGRPPDPQRLTEILGAGDFARRQLRQAAAWCVDREYARATSQFHLDGTVSLSSKSSPLPAGAIPLALIGGPLPPGQWHLFEAVSASGGCIVLNATETGERTLERDSSLPEPAPGDLPAMVHVLARQCVRACIDVFQRPNTPLYDWLRPRLAARRVRGILLWHFVGCDLWRAEAESLRESFGLPVLALDSDGAPGEAVRIAGRIQAFLEALR
jgi:hypothetical protein